VALTLIGGGGAFAILSNKTAGPRPDGTAITSVGYKVTPAGAQTRTTCVTIDPGNRDVLSWTRVPFTPDGTCLSAAVVRSVGAGDH
jgi:hypothetical protein